jgi:hypothetical protein
LGSLAIGIRMCRSSAAPSSAETKPRTPFGTNSVVVFESRPPGQSVASARRQHQKIDRMRRDVVVDGVDHVRSARIDLVNRDSQLVEDVLRAASGRQPPPPFQIPAHARKLGPMMVRTAHRVRVNRRETSAANGGRGNLEGMNKGDVAPDLEVRRMQHRAKERQRTHLSQIPRQGSYARVSSETPGGGGMPQAPTSTGMASVRRCRSSA